MSRHVPHLSHMASSLILVATAVAVTGCSATGTNELAYSEAGQEMAADEFLDVESTTAMAQRPPDRLVEPAAAVMPDTIGDAEYEARRLSYRMPDETTADVPSDPSPSTTPGGEPVDTVTEQPPRQTAHRAETQRSADQTRPTSENEDGAEPVTMTAFDSGTEAIARRGVEKVGASDFQDVVLGSELPVIVDFYADWCGPCRRVAPLLEHLADEQPDVRVVKVNIDDDKALARKYQVRSIPSVMIFQDGNLVARHTGIPSIREALAR